MTTYVEATQEQRDRWNATRNASSKARYATDPEYRAELQARARDYHRERYLNDPQFREAEKEKQYRLKYGLSREEVYGMLESQGFVCALCLEDMFEPENVDHDHVTGAIRGILCNRCNVGLGLFHEDISLFVKATDYILVNL